MPVPEIVDRVTPTKVFIGLLTTAGAVLISLLLTDFWQHANAPGHDVSLERIKRIEEMTNGRLERLERDNERIFALLLEIRRTQVSPSPGGK